MRSRALLAVFFALPLAHCGTSVSPMSDSAADVSPDVPSEAATDAPHDVLPDLPFCFSDFPCFGRRFQCNDITSYVALIDHDCHYGCGPGPCSGGSCDPAGPIQHCGAGTVCVSSSISPGMPSPDQRPTPCEPPDAGASDASCD